MLVDVLVLGGGAAGLFCAATAGARGRSVLVLEHNARVGQKIAISGGGRCNFTNIHAAPENYLCAQPDFPKSALARYTPADFVALVEKHGVRYHEKKLGQLFCDGSSREIIALLTHECADVGAQVFTDCKVQAVEAVNHDNTARFLVRTNRGVFHARSLVVATGGLSFPKLGASDLAYRLARQFGLRVTRLRAGLVPLTFAGDTLALCQELSGVALPCVVRAAGEKSGPAFRENLLFTHRGISGPAVLQISSYLPDHVAGSALICDLLPDASPDAEPWLRAARGRDAQLANFLAERLPARFAVAFAGAAAARPLRRFSDAELAALARRLRAWTLRPSGTEGYPKAEVTLGGVDTRELSSKTLEARTVPGLHFIGECVDVTGQLGGYNFQWAWASAHAAGEAV
ncbi:MAG: NAD(P)/FAD-dependent oxidoreductase [Verrucomicrobia bacterium]|nr:NAD(P)/FAD-dependent oxidoreductase [Verrucomicrobiota bacterium]